LEVGAGSSLTLTANGSIVTVVQLSTGAVGSVSGNLILTGTGTANANRPLSPDVDGISFESGSTFQWAPGGTGPGNPFGTTNFGSIRFKSGSTAYQGGTTTGPSAGTGSAIQAGTLPNNVCTFDPGSLFYNWTSVHALSGRTYGNYQADNRGSVANQTGTSSWVVNGDLTFKGTMNAALNVNLTAAVAMSVTGNLTVEPNGRFGDTATPAAESVFQIAGNIDLAGPNVALSSNANRVWLLNGAANQSVSIPAGLSFPVLRVNKAGGDVNLASNISVNHALQLTAGNIVTGSNTLTLLAGTTFTGPGRIIGNVARVVDATVLGPRTFPTDANPVTIDITGAGTGTGTITVVTDSLAGTGLPQGSTGISRTWTITPDVISGYTATIVFDYTGSALNGATEANLVAARFNGSTWDVLGGTVDTVSKTVTVTGVTNFSTWTLIDPSTSVRDWMSDI
jgi:hypothetical protein